MIGEKIHDVVIVGAGPAGLTAALICARSGLSVQVIGKITGGQAAEAPLIENYPGFKSITGIELTKIFAEQVESVGVTILNDEVLKVEQVGDLFEVRTSFNGDFKCRSVILAIGAEPRKLGVKGEEEFSGRGVSYCATCDGPLFKGKDVAVVGGGIPALSAALYLSGLAKNVYLIHDKGTFRAFKTLVDKVNEKANIVKKLNTTLLEIGGKKFVEWIKIRDNESGKEEEVKVSGVFVEIGKRINSDFLRGFVELDSRGQIVIDSLCRTSRRGVFAAGDATTTPYKQVIIAAGEGAKAAMSAYEYLKGAMV
ncbi:MAG: FAD-dependent oxidoreductase [Candidatus Nezhaarchaeales archaeon]